MSDQKEKPSGNIAEFINPLRSLKEKTAAPKRRIKKGQIIRTTNRIKRKTGTGKGIPERVIRRAKAMLVRMEDSFYEIILEDLESISDALDRFAQGDEQALQAMHDITHEVRGQAGTFGYDFATHVAASLCRFIQENSDPEEGEVELLEAHVDALRSIIAHKIKGTTNETGHLITSGLETMVKKQKQKKQKQ